MNIVVQFLKSNWKRLGLETYGSSSDLFCLMATPRFRASSHVIFFVFMKTAPDPILVVKIPRLAGDKDSLDREAANLRNIFIYRNCGFDSVPRVVAYEEFHDNWLLVETALPGQAMSSALVRTNRLDFNAAVISWLIEFQLATKQMGSDDKGWFARLVERPLDQFQRAMPFSQEERLMLDITQKMTHELRHKDIPLVFEHRDLGPPNILLRENGSIGVVDWELAEPRGLPALDLFFFLSLSMFASHGARKNSEYLAAFQDAFFGRNAWARPHIDRYMEKFELAPETLGPLFLLCWCRYLINIVSRLKQKGEPQEALSNDTVSWLRSNRYYVLWSHTVNNLDELNLAN